MSQPGTSTTCVLLCVQVPALLVVQASECGGGLWVGGRVVGGCA